MRRQTADHDCGPTAIANAFEALHRPIGLRGLRDLCACAPEENDGTDEDGIIRALLHYGYGVDEFKSDDPRAAWVWLIETVREGRPVLLCVDRWDHWVTVIGNLGKDLNIYDPARPGGGLADHPLGGVAVLRWKSLRARWEAARQVRGKGPRFYGIAVGPP